MGDRRGGFLAIPSGVGAAVNPADQSVAGTGLSYLPPLTPGQAPTMVNPSDSPALISAGFDGGASTVFGNLSGTLLTATDAASAPVDDADGQGGTVTANPGSAAGWRLTVLPQRRHRSRCTVRIKLPAALVNYSDVWFAASDALFPTLGQIFDPFATNTIAIRFRLAFSPNFFVYVSNGASQSLDTGIVAVSGALLRLDLSLNPQFAIINGVKVDYSSLVAVPADATALRWQVVFGTELAAPASSAILYKIWAQGL